jgi:hypothetical protein
MRCNALRINDVLLGYMRIVQAYKLASRFRPDSSMPSGNPVPIERQGWQL